MGKKSKQEKAKKASKGPEGETGPTRDPFQGTAVPVKFIKFCCDKINPASISDRDRDAIIYRWEQERYTVLGMGMYGGEGPAEDERKSRSAEHNPVARTSTGTTTGIGSLSSTSSIKAVDHGYFEGCTLPVESAEATTALPSNNLSSAATFKLDEFMRDYMSGSKKVMDSWVKSEFHGDYQSCRASAEGGNAKAQLAMSLEVRHIDIDEGKGDSVEYLRWLGMATSQGDADALLMMCLQLFLNKVRLPSDAPAGDKKKSLRKAAEGGSSTAQHIMGLICCMQNDSTSKADMLEAARWFRMAAHQGLPWAQYELGDMFRQGLFCDVNMRFARKYMRRAARPSTIPEATARVVELHRCVCCGAEAAPRKCSLCREARYCDSTCSKRHWYHGGGCVGIGGGGSQERQDAPHKETCPRIWSGRPSDETSR